MRITNRDSKIRNFLRAVSTSFLQKPRIYLLAEMQKCPLAKHEVVKTLCLAFHNNYSSIEKLQELHPQEDQNPQIPDCAGTSFINLYIPDYLLSRQGKSLDCEWELFLIRLCRKGKGISFVPEGLFRKKSALFCGVIAIKSMPSARATLRTGKGTGTNKKSKKITKKVQNRNKTVTLGCHNCSC